MVEAVSGGCIEQQNVYDVFDHETKKRIMVSEVIDIVVFIVSVSIIL